MLWTLLLLLSRWIGLHQFCSCVQSLLLLLYCLGVLPGTILCTSVETDGTGLMIFTFKLLPKNKEAPSTGVHHHSVLDKKAKGSLRPLAKAKVDWVYDMSLLLLLELEAAMVSLFFLAGFSLHSTFLSAPFLRAEGGQSKKVVKSLSKLLYKQRLMLLLSLAASMQLESIALQSSLLR